MDLEKIKARVAKIPTDDLMMWADNAASGMQRHLDDYRRSPDEAYLGEISLAALTMGRRRRHAGRTCPGGPETG